MWTQTAGGYTTSDPQDIERYINAINRAGQQILSTVGLSNDQLQSENPAVRADASQKREQAAETIHSVNESMLSVIPGADVAYKVANDREVTKGDIAWATAGLLPVGKIGKIAKVAEEGTSIWSKTKTLSAVENAFGHWKKHGKEFSEFQNAKQYVEGAKDFLHNSPSGTLMKVRPNGDILKYYPKTNTFGVMDATGTPRTMFKPIDGIKYWKKQ